MSRSTSKQRQRKKARKAMNTVREIQKRAADLTPQWWVVELNKPHRFPGTLLTRKRAYVLDKTPHGVVVKLAHLGAEASTANMRGLGGADFWRCDVPLSAAFAVRVA